MTSPLPMVKTDENEEYEGRRVHGSIDSPVPLFFDFLCYCFKWFLLKGVFFHLVFLL